MISREAWERARSMLWSGYGCDREPTVALLVEDKLTTDPVAKRMHDATRAVLAEQLDRIAELERELGIDPERPRAARRLAASFADTVLRDRRRREFKS